MDPGGGKDRDAISAAATVNSNSIVVSSPKQKQGQQQQQQPLRNGGPTCIRETCNGSRSPKTNGQHGGGAEDLARSDNPESRKKKDTVVASAGLVEESFLSPTLDGPNPRAILDLNAETGGSVSPCKSAAVRARPGDLHDFISSGAATVNCELHTDRRMSVAEVKEHAISRLQTELRKAQEELKLKDEEVARLSQIRDRLGAEFEDLSASLFQEAHKMVREANVNQAAAEKSLKEANLKIEVLQAEVQALKTLVLTSTPSMPNRHLHPHLDTKSPARRAEAEDAGMGGSTSFIRGHKRSPSHCNLKYGRETTPPGSPVRGYPEPLIGAPFCPEDYEIDPLYHSEFVKWRENPQMDRNHPFLDRVYREDIEPCFNFTNKELADQVWKCIEENSIIIEAVSGKSPFPKRCALLDAPRLCRYRMKVDNFDQWYYISQLCRDRVAAVCDFLCYLRYIQQGLVKSNVHDVYWEIIRLRKRIALARLGVH